MGAPLIRAVLLVLASAGAALGGDDDVAHRLERLRGRVVVVNFWATWCVPCREEMPMLARLAREYRDRGVVFVGPSADTDETRHGIAPLLREANVDFAVWEGATTTDMRELDLGMALPATAVLGRDGRVAYRILGPVTEPELRARLDTLLGAPGDDAPAARLVTHPEPEDDGHDRDHAEHAHTDEHGHAHGDDEDHQHGAVALEGASLVPS